MQNIIRKYKNNELFIDDNVENITYFKIFLKINNLRFM
jgi:hypothetical protein